MHLNIGLIIETLSLLPCLPTPVAGDGIGECLGLLLLELVEHDLDLLLSGQ